MKKILTPVMALASIFACANVSAEQIILNDFNDGTTQGWNKGGAADKPLTNETEADGNGYIKLISEGESSTDADKKIVFQNASGEWRGNYIAKGAQSITARFKNMGPDDVELHAAFGNTLADLRTRWVTTKGAVIPNDGEWHEAFFSFAPAELTMVPLGGHGKSNASFSAQETLGNVNTVRFSQGTLGDETGQGHSAEGLYTGWNGGPEVEADLWIDDIALSTDRCSADMHFMASMGHCMANSNMP
ncbi:hypothetical protein [Methyloprofundus sp.]|uniref:hypothetical protein n=1 Tax=Methyloprofundus sp. TaxID=2020875 RepID=UPI003D0D6ED0